MLNNNNNLMEIEIETDISSILSDISSIDLNMNELNVKRIKNNRNRPRINYGIHLGALAFDILWEDDSESREPIQHLINIDNETINEYIINIIQDYKDTCKKFPTKNRCCIMCYDKVYNGSFICSKHSLQYNFMLDD